MTTPTTKTAAKKAGHRAAQNGVAYEEGQYIFNKRDAELLLAWSKGHNQARAGMIKRS